MIDFLKKYGISSLAIKEMEKVNSSANLYNFNCNQDEVVKILNFLREHGVKCIEQLLINRIDMFFVDFNKFYKLYVKDDVDTFVKTINEDYMSME